MSGGGVKIALAVSLALNVFIVGAIVGGVYMHRRPPPPPGNAVAQAGDLLNPADRDAFRQMVRARIATVRPIQQDAREARRDAMTALQSPTFDRGAVQALMDRARADDDKVRAVMETSVLDFAATLPAPERVALVQGMRRRAGRRGLFHHPGPDGPPPPSDGPPQP